MDFVCDIASFVGNMFSFLFDKLWWKDYGIPLIGTVGIPLVVWILTRYYGADKAEERKELRILKNNLSFLESIIRENIKKFLALRERTATIIDIESRTKGVIEPRELEVIISTLIVTDYFDVVDLEKYAPCSKYNQNFISYLVILKSIMQMLHRKIDVRNGRMKAAGSIDELTKDCNGTLNILRQDCRENKEFYQELNNIILKNKNLIYEIQNIEKKIGVPVCNLIKFTEDEVKLFTQIEKEYSDYMKEEGLTND